MTRIVEKWSQKGELKFNRESHNYTIFKLVTEYCHTSY